MSDNNQITRAERRAELETMEFTRGTQGGALMTPRNGRDLMDMANMMAQSDFMVKDFYRGNPGACAGLIMVCQPYGFNPFQVSWKTYKAAKSGDAPIAYEAQLVNAMVNVGAPIRGKLKYAYEGDGQNRRCTITGIDKESGDELTYTSPPVGQIKVKNSPLWQSDPDMQLGYFSARSWARRHFPEMLLGVYARDEIEDSLTEPKDITPDNSFAGMARAAREKAAEPAEQPVGAQVEDAEVITPEDEDGAVEGADAEERAFREFKANSVDGDLFAE